jgi:hypothetical protein
MSRGGHNIEYYKGYEMESNLYKRYIPILKQVLKADLIELTTRSIIDKNTGTDAVALIQNTLLGISLRFRNQDYNSFTLSRHISDKYSEVHKWSKERKQGIKPAYFIQIAKRKDGKLRLIKVNIDGFGYYLRYLISTNQLEQFYKPHLKAYDFNLDLVSGLEYEEQESNIFKLSCGNKILNRGF